MMQILAHRTLLTKVTIMASKFSPKISVHHKTQVPSLVLHSRQPASCQVKTSCGVSTVQPCCSLCPSFAARAATMVCSPDTAKWPQLPYPFLILVIGNESADHFCRSEFLPLPVPVAVTEMLETVHQSQTQYVSGLKEL